MSDRSPAVAPERPRPIWRILGLRLGLALLATGVIAFYFWSLHCVSRLSLREKQTDYYALQVHGWRKGSLAMDVTPHPDLRVEYPNKIVSAAPYLLDASYYQGKYYLYFGPAPALVLLLPYNLITGWDIPEALAAAVFASLGFLLALAWMLCLVRTFFPSAGAGVQWVGLLALGLANLAPVALVRPLFYELAVSSSYAFTQAMLLAAALAVIRPRQALTWLTLASLAAGLAAGSRPNSIVGAALALPLVTAGIWWQGERTLRRALGLLAAAGLPAALCGLGLLWHNHARYDRWFEFGVNLQLGSNPEGFGFAARHFWHNLKLYYLTPPLLDWYFPFVGPGPEPLRPAGYYGVEEMHGQFVLLPVIGLAGLIAACRLGGRSPVDRRVVLIVGAAILAAVANFSLVAATGVRTSRYMLDFQPALLLALVAATFAGATDSRRFVRWLGRLAAVGLAVAAIYNVFVSFHIGSALPVRDPDANAALTRTFNRLAAPLQQRFAPPPGPQRWRVTFPTDAIYRVEPLVVAGVTGQYDGLFVEFLQAGRARLAFFHYQHGTIRGPEFDYPPGGTAELEINLGTLYPPVGHPWYGDRPLALQQRLRHSIAAKLDGRVILDAGASCYLASPRTVGIGLRWLADWGEPRFNGRIERLAPGAVPNPPLNGERLDEAYEVLFPQGMTGTREPIITLGPPRVAPIDTVYVEYAGPGAIRFGYDSAGQVATSPDILINFTTPHALELHYEPSARDGSHQGFVRIHLDGHVVWAAPLWSRLHPDMLMVPLASGGLFSSSRQLFTGTVLRREPAPPAPPTGPDWVLPPAMLSRNGAAPTGPQILATWIRPDRRQATLTLEHQPPANAMLSWQDGSGPPATGSLSASKSKPIALRVRATPEGAAIEANGETVLQVGSDFFTGPAPTLWVGNALAPNGVPSGTFAGTLRPTRRPAQAVPVPEEGPLALHLKLPQDRMGRREPLVVIGQTGLADGFYVHYLDAGHIAFGYDHWGVPAPESPPIPIDLAAEHVVWVDFDSLHADREAHTGRLRVRLNGREVWNLAVASHGYAEAGPLIGKNEIGLSLIEPAFTGEIHRVVNAP